MRSWDHHSEFNIFRYLPNQIPLKRPSTNRLQVGQAKLHTPFSWWRSTPRADMIQERHPHFGMWVPFPFRPELQTDAVADTSSLTFIFAPRRKISMGEGGVCRQDRISEVLVAVHCLFSTETLHSRGWARKAYFLKSKARLQHLLAL
jgi:hypothetical protein